MDENQNNLQFQSYPSNDKYSINGQSVKIGDFVKSNELGIVYKVIDISDDGKTIKYQKYSGNTLFQWNVLDTQKTSTFSDFCKNTLHMENPPEAVEHTKVFKIGTNEVEVKNDGVFEYAILDDEKAHLITAISEDSITIENNGFYKTYSAEEFQKLFPNSCQLTTVAATESEEEAAAPTESEEEAAAPTESEEGMVSMVDDSSDLEEELTGKDGVTSELEQSDNPKINIIHGRLINSNVEAVVQGVKDFMKAHTSFDPTTYVDKKFSIQKINGLVINQSTAEEYKHEKFPQPIDKSNNDILQEFIETYNENSDKIILKCEENKNILIETKEPFNEILELNKLTDVVQGLNSNKSAVNNIQKVDSIITLYNSQLDNLKKAVTKLKMEEQLQKEKEKLEQIKRMNDEVD